MSSLRSCIFYSLFFAWFLQSCEEQIPQEYVIDEKDFVPEGIAYSKLTDAYYLTSVAKSKINKIDRKSGVETLFSDEYAPGAGILVDDERKKVYAVGGYYLIPDSTSGLFVYDLDSGQLLERHIVDDSREHFFNDLINDSKGNLYITNTKDSSIYFLGRHTKKLELFYRSPEIEFPNGIAISDDDSTLYVASFPNGIRILDIESRELLNGRDSLGVSQGIDGLEFYNGHLFAIQNGSQENGFNFRKLLLDHSGKEILSTKIIDEGNPDLDVPLTFCIYNEEALVIGNSNLQFLDQVSMEFSSADSIRNSKLLKYKIEN